jgi:acyl dehydratase
VPVDQSYKGRVYPPTPPYEVSREKIREFADAINDPNPLYRDRAVAESHGYPDVIAPPTFPIILSLKAGHQVIVDPAFGIDYSRVVHGEQKFVHHRPIHPGDELTATTHIDDIRDAGANELLTMRMEIRTTDGELVCEATNVVVSRGTAAGK